MKPADDMRLDDALGPEFSNRIMYAMERHGVETIGQLREQLPNLRKWWDLGAKSVKEIEDFYKQLDRPANLFDDPAYVRYQMEDKLGTITAIMHDVQNAVLRAALKGRISAEVRRHVAFKLLDAAEAAEQLPCFTEN